MNQKKIINKFLEKAFLKERDFPSGCSCTYIKISKTLGVKCYVNDGSDCNNRSNTFRRQRLAYKHGIAPKPYFKFEFYNNFEGDKWMCYVTQHAKTPSNSFYDKYEDELISKLDKLDFNVGDIRKDNCGVINGKLVCIDFDDGSMS